jgi:hypothetical protein
VVGHDAVHCALPTTCRAGHARPRCTPHVDGALDTDDDGCQRIGRLLQHLAAAPRRLPALLAQCLFACHGERRPGAPVGVLVYLRTLPEVMRILHLVVHPDYEHGGGDAHLNLSIELVKQLRHMARRISGVRRVQLPYVAGGYLSVPTLAAG